MELQGLQREAVHRQGESGRRVVVNIEKTFTASLFPQYHTRAAGLVWQIYGKGKAADCRRHVQKLNMLRAEKEQRGIEEIQSSHPPEHYADTFTAQERQVEEIVSQKMNDNS